MILKFLTLAAFMIAVFCSPVRPADDDVAKQVRSIEIEEFSGNRGDRLQQRIESKLSAVSINNESYFDISSRPGDQDADALLSGSANLDIDIIDTEESRRRCVERDADDKCLERKFIDVFCNKRTITLLATVRFTVLQKGSGRFVRDFEPKVTETVCDNEGRLESFPNENRQIDDLTENLAVEIRHTLAPAQRREKIRLLESRKGLSKEDAKAFKAAVKKTKSDAQLSCSMFEQLEESGAANVSLAYNLGLCSERIGDLDKAQERYEASQSRFGQKQEVTAAIQRLSDHRNALRDLEARAENSPE